MAVLGVLMVGIIIAWIIAWIFVIADMMKCRKCDWKSLCINSTLSHYCPKKNRLSEEGRKSLKKKIDELDD